MAKDIEQKTPKFKFYVSNIAIWWNKGIEAKPSFSWFIKNIDWEEITDTESFTVSWVDETHIKVIVPLSKRNHLIRIEDLNLATNQYYFLVEELNRTNRNVEAIFQLDIWTSFIMSGEYLQDNLRTTQNLDINGVSEYVNILPNGIPTGRIIKKKCKINRERNIFTKGSREYGKCFTLSSKDFSGVVGEENTRIENNNIYFVFTERNSSGTHDFNRNKDNTNYILVPVMNCDTMGLFTTLPAFYGEEWAAEFKEGKYAWLLPTWLCNSYQTLLKVVENKSNDHLGLGEFVGVWVGPSILRIKEVNLNKKGQRIFGPESTNYLYTVDNFYLTITHDYRKLEEQKKWDLRNTNIVEREWVKYFEEIKSNPAPYRGTYFGKNIVSPNVNKLWNDNNGVYPHSRAATLFCLRVGSGTIKLSNILVNKEDFVKNINYLGNPNNFLTVHETDMFFNQKFTFTNGKDMADIDIQIPTAYDNYQNMLNAQRNTMNTSLWTSGAGSLFSLATQLVGGVGIAKLGKLEKFRLGVERGFNNRVPTNILDDAEAEKWAVNSVKNDMLIGVNENQIRAKNLNRLTVNALLGGNSALQFFNTLAQQAAYKRDLRTTISNTITNMTDNYVLFYKMIEETLTREETLAIINSNDIQFVFDKLATEIFYGYEVEPSKLIRFYGYEDIPRLITKEFYKSNDCYIKIDELTKLDLDLHLTKRFTPIIKEGIITLLNNGVRVVNNPTELDIN